MWGNAIYMLPVLVVSYK